jgi:hypothetical protein
VTARFDLLAAPCIRRVQSFEDLVATPLAGGVNAICWQRTLAGDFGEVVGQLESGEGVVALDEERLRSLPLGDAGRAAVAIILADLKRLRDRDLDPVLNCIHAYPRDEESEALPTDVYSFHADSAPVPAETWLCTYYGAPSEGLRNDEARRRIDVPEMRTALRQAFGEGSDDEFEAHLHASCQDLHYVPLPTARPYSFGLGNLWRIAVGWPGSPVLPCIHRAPATHPDEPPRLLLIS